MSATRARTLVARHSSVAQRTNLVVTCIFWLGAAAAGCSDPTNETSVPLSAAGAAGARGPDGCPVFPLSELCRDLTVEQCRKAQTPLGKDSEESRALDFCTRVSRNRGGLSNVDTWKNACDGRTVTAAPLTSGSPGETQYHFDEDDKLIGVSLRDYTATDPCQSIRHYGKTCALEERGACVAAAATGAVVSP